MKFADNVKSLSIKHLHKQLAEITKSKEPADHSFFLGYVTCLHDIQILDLKEFEEFILLARQAMQFD